MAFWERFYNLCIENNTKPNTVAKELGFSSSLCTQWKQGLQKPSYDKASKLAEYFNVSVEYLLEKSLIKKTFTQPEYIEAQKNAPVEKAKAELNAELSELEEAEIDELIDFAKYLKLKRKKLTP